MRRFLVTCFLNLPRCWAYNHHNNKGSFTILYMFAFGRKRDLVTLPYMEW